MKREVAEETATGIGFFEGILDKIPKDILFDAIREMSVNQWIDEKTKSSEIMNMTVTESIRLMTYQEFKEVAPYLFSYPQKQRELDSKLFVKMIEITQEQFDDFQSAIRELMKIRENNMNETTSFDHIKSTAEWHAEELMLRDNLSFSEELSNFGNQDISENVINDDRYGYIVHDLQVQSSGFMDYATGYSLEAIIEIRWSDYLNNQEEAEGLDPDVIPDWFDKDFIEDMWQIEIVPLTRDDLISLGIDGYSLSTEQQVLIETANAQIEFLKGLDLWYVGSVDYYSFGYMPDDLIDALLIDGSFGDESDRHEFEDYYGWFKGGGEASNTLIAMPGTSLVDDVFLSDINLINEYDEELDIKEIKKLLDNLSKFEVSPNLHQKPKNKPLRTR